jgi:protein-disulfide isomerase
VLDKNPETVRFVSANFPLSSHKMAMKAAMAALAAEKQGKYWEFYHKLYENYKSLTDKKIEQIAEDLKLDWKKLEKDMNSSEVKQLVNRDIRNARKIGIRGIPSIFINGRPLRNRSLQGFQEIIDAELKKTGN